MLKTRILLIAISAALVALLFLLPRIVVENDQELAEGSTEAPENPAENNDFHASVAPELASRIAATRTKYETAEETEKSAIFADSLSQWYEKAGKLDSAAWYAEEAATFFNTQESWIKAGNQYYQAYNLAIDKGKQAQMAAKAQEVYGHVLENDPNNLDVKTKLAMTWVSSSNPMQGITMLREVLAQNPKHEEALYDMGMLSYQSGQYGKAIERLENLVKINPQHIQGQLLLGVSLMNAGQKERARKTLETVKKLDQDPAVQATVDSYLKDLK